MTDQEIPFKHFLWPADAVGSEGRTYLPVIRGGDVRALLPADRPGKLSRAMRYSNTAESARRRLMRRGVALGGGALLRVRASALPLFKAPHAGLEQHLGSLIGDPISLAAYFGPSRANAKPVFRLLDDRGGLRAVAKLGVSELTDRLIRNEASALTQLGGGSPPQLAVPRVVALDEWAGHPLLVQTIVGSPLRSRPPAAQQRTVAERVVACSGPEESSGTIADYLAGLQADAATLVEHDWLTTGIGHLVEFLGETDVRLGPWHGDWSPQNLQAHDGGVAAWDWERWAPQRPCGFDTLHFQLQSKLAGPEPDQAGVALVESAGELLSPWQPSLTIQQRSAVAGLLLAEIATRYLADGQLGTGSPGGRLEIWLRPALTRLGGDGG